MTRMAMLCGACLTLAGCGFGGSSGPTYQETLQSWVGAEERSLVDKWGRPSETFDYTSGGRQLVYRTRYVSYDNTVSYCETVFDVDHQGIVKSGKWTEEGLYGYAACQSGETY